MPTFDLMDRQNDKTITCIYLTNTHKKHVSPRPVSNTNLSENLLLSVKVNFKLWLTQWKDCSKL